MKDKKKLRIAVCDTVTSFGGVQRVMVNLLPQLAGEFDICVVDPYANPDYAKQLMQVNIPIYFNKPSFKKPYIGGKKTWKRPFKLFFAVPKIIKIIHMYATALAEISPDCIYSNQLSTLRLLGLVAPLHRIPLIYHAHGFAKASDISRFAVKFLNTSARVVIANSKRTADILRQAGVRPDIIHVCHNAVCIAEVQHLAQLPANKPLPVKKPGQVIFLLPAVIQHIKGQHLVIEALAKVAEKGHDVTLWLAGDVATGGNQQYLKELHRMADKLGIAPLVHFLGWRDDIYQLMAAADVVMLCSLTESFGMALAEAMVLSKPCIGANIGGMPEVIADKQTGLLFTPKSVDSLIDAMVHLTVDTQMRIDFGKAGKQRVMQCFTISAQAKAVSTLINSITS